MKCAPVYLVLTLIAILILTAPFFFAEIVPNRVIQETCDEIYYEDFFIPVDTPVPEVNEHKINDISHVHVQSYPVEINDDKCFFELLNQYRSLPPYTEELKKHIQKGEYWMVSHKIQEMKEISEPILKNLEKCKTSSRLWKPREIMREGLFCYSTGAKDLLAGIQKHSDGDLITELELIHPGEWEDGK